MSTDMVADLPAAQSTAAPASSVLDEDETLPTMGAFNIPIHPKRTPKVAEAYLFETTKLRVHNLPPDKAVTITQALVAEIKPFHYRDRSGTKVQFDPGSLQVLPGLDDKNRKTHSAIVQFHPDATETGAADLYGLDLLRQKLDEGIYPTRWSHARANDRSTVVKFDFVINEKNQVGKEKLITSDEAMIELKRMWKTRGYEWRQAWSIVRSAKSMSLSGHAACSNPRGIAELIKDSPVQLLLPPPNDCFWKCELSPADDFIPVTYGTTIATYIAGRYVSDTQLANDLHNLACEFNKDRPQVTQRWYFRTGRSPCGKWFLCDPSHLDLAAYLCSVPNITEDFYELAYNINSGFPAAFKLEEINRKKAEKTAAYNATQVVRQGKQFVSLGDDALREIRKGNKKIHALDVGLQEANKRMRRIEQGQDATNTAIGNTVNMIEQVQRDRILDRRITNLEFEQARLEARRDGLDADDGNRLVVEKLLMDVCAELATIRPPTIPLITNGSNSDEAHITPVPKDYPDVEMETAEKVTAITTPLTSESVTPMLEVPAATPPAPSTSAPVASDAILPPADDTLQASSPLTDPSIELADPPMAGSTVIPETPVSKTRIADLTISGDANAENDAAIMTRTTRRTTRREQSAQQQERATDTSPTRQGVREVHQQQTDLTCTVGREAVVYCYVSIHRQASLQRYAMPRHRAVLTHSVTYPIPLLITDTTNRPLMYSTSYSLVYTLLDASMSLLIIHLLSNGSVLLAIMIYGIVTAPGAMANHPTLTILSLNTNKLNDNVMKSQEIVQLILRAAPSIFVLTETNIYDGPPSAIFHALKRTYQFFTTPPKDQARSAGGITIGVIHDIPVARGTQILQEYQHNMLTVNIKTPDFAGSKKMLDTLIVGIYAPQALTASGFWRYASTFIGTRDRWILAGDCNMILRPCEASTNHSLLTQVDTTQNTYRQFLSELSASDLWLLQEEFDLEDDATLYRRGSARGGGNSFSVIDRIAIGPQIPGGHIETLPEQVTASDHRAIFSRLPMPIIHTRQWNTVPLRPRLKKPEKDDPAWENFANRLTAFAEQNDLSRRPLQTNQDFDELYRIVAQEFRQACEDTFTRPNQGKGLTALRLNERQRHLRHIINLVKRARAAIQRHRWDTFVGNLSLRDKDLLEYKEDDMIEVTLLKMVRIRRVACKEISSISRERDDKRTQQAMKSKVELALKTGSAKRLLPNQAVRIPPIVKDPNNPGDYIFEPEAVTEAIRDHFDKIYTQDPPPVVDKPWMRTVSSKRFREKSSRTPFEWPIKMTANDLQSQLSQGNRSPAPGPDDWEKWAIARSGKDWLTVLSRLVNYICENEYFSTTLKENYIVPIWKKGDTTDPTNYRGIVLANSLQCIAASWHTFHFQNYVWKMGFIPEGQIAAQKGVQVADMSQLLHAIDGYGKITDQTWLAVKRDQQKGFDQAHGSAVPDFMSFFGISEKALSFDRARTTAVSLKVRVHNRLSTPIITDGQTKQGDSFSMIKYVLMTAMAAWWLHDMDTETGIVIATPNKMNGRQAHQPADYLKIVLKILSATDDTILLAKNVEQLRTMIYDMEVFQRAYNMKTEWDKPDKSTLFLLGKIPKSDQELQQYELTMTLPTGKQIQLKPTEDRTFLKTPINDPNTQADTLKAIVRNFIFPRPSQALPITALRRIAEVSLMGKIRPRLAQHPISNADAETLGSALGVKIKKYLGLPFYLNYEILGARLKDGGFAFPDFQKMNMMNSVMHLHRGLNSNNRTIYTVFQIVHATYQCHHLHCYPPFGPDLSSTPGSHHNPTRNKMKVWEIARKYLQDMQLEIFPRHLTENLSSTTTMHKGRANKDQLLRQQGKGLEHLLNDMSRLVERQLPAAGTAEHTSLRQSDIIRWATDGSMIPANLMDERPTALAVIGPINFAAKMKFNRSSIQDAETLAIALAILLDTRMRKRIPALNNRSVILTDHLNTVRFARQLRENSFFCRNPQESSRHARKLLAVALKHNRFVDIVHQKAHTDDTSLEARMNDAADKAAKAAREGDETVAVPIDCCDKYVLWHTDTGISHEKVSTLLQTVWHKMRPQQFFNSSETTTYVDKDLLLRTHAGKSIIYQMQIRAKQLPTPARNHDRPRPNRPIPLKCISCDIHASEATEHHIFTQCPGTRDLRRQHEAKILEQIDSYMTYKDLKDSEVHQRHVRLGEQLISGGPLWGEGTTEYWKGVLPGAFEYDKDYRWLYGKLSGLCIKATGHIWGQQLAREHNSQ